MGQQNSPASALPKRDRVAILTGLAGITVLAWAYLIQTARHMTSMAGIPHIPEIVTLRSWTGTDFLLMFLMWAIMMVGMMLPAAAPMTLV